MLDKPTLVEMNKFLVQIEFRYTGPPRNYYDEDSYICKKLTLGVFDTRDEANQAGNDALVEFERRFALNKYHNKRERFSTTGGCFGYPNDLISDLAYLETPFTFFASVKELHYGDINECLDEVLSAIKKRKELKND